ncbi:X-linked retinitis pigmentosa GTPase regulator [Amphibalanus amphitrite]|uniref:X-linked retinitis pigmentosa GTPase regulator n=1 Tax=Amphibalanus amphitrite TaxID=1232801 RepID=A0A6A4WGI1_AMPAM|nr:X-linked retinitis pigmentosa GTPase regulator [Amphibalanus amphitrite]
MSVRAQLSFKIKISGELYTFGENDDGQLGLGDREGRSRPTAVPRLGSVTRVGCGGQHTVALTESGEVWCFGGGSQGQLGLGSRLLTAPTPQLLSLGQLRGREVAAGHCHSAVVTEDHQLLTFGDSRHGKLCTGDEESNVFTPQPASEVRHLHIAMVVLGGCQTMVLVERRPVSPGRRSPQQLIANGLPPPSDDVHSSARQRRREREVS